MTTTYPRRRRGASDDCGDSGGVKKVLLEHYRIDETHSNSYSVWKAMGSPQAPTPGAVCAAERGGATGASAFPGVA
jgi:hypothetical protein